MAQAVRYVCGGCGYAITAWSDGYPYYIDRAGGKQYAYHPDHERLALCVGNDSPHLCLSCAHEFIVDSKAPVAACPKCGASELTETYQLEGKRCPYCKAGVFAADPDFLCIS
jgi:DNA-directed RNA polymerase subunit RPC12/RpoP